MKRKAYRKTLDKELAIRLKPFFKEVNK